MTLSELRKFIRSCIERMTALNDVLVDESRSEFGDAEQAEWDQLDAWVDDAKRQASRLERVETLASEHPSSTEPGSPAPAVHVRTDDPWDPAATRHVSPFDEDARGTLHERARTALDTIPKRILKDAGRERIEEILEIDNERGAAARHVLATANPVYRKAFLKLMKDPSGLDLSDQERSSVKEMRAMSLTGASGGFAIPTTLDPTFIITGAGSKNPFRDPALGVNIVTTVTDQYDGVTAGQVTASWDGEAAEVSDDAPTLVQPSVSVHKLQVFVPYSIEAGQDISALEAEAGRLFSDSRDNAEATAFVTGSGTNQPWGVVTRVIAVTASRVAATTNNAFGLPDVYLVDNAVPARFEDEASWLAHKAIYNLVRQFDTSGGAGLWERLAGGLPPELLGSPAFKTSAMDSALGTGNDDILVKGAFSRYRVVDRVGLTVELIPHLFATATNRPSGQRGLYAYSRVGADTLDNNAFRILRV